MKALGLAMSTLLLGACASTERTTELSLQVRTTELAFARTMADRDFGAFQRFLSKDAIFFGSHSIAHGVAQISAVWQPLFSGAAAPFSWAPDKVEVLPSGDLALSTGPVYVDGVLTGRFDSVWRREARGKWRIVFDKGEPLGASDR